MPRNLGDAFVRVRPDTDGFAGEARTGISPGLKRVAGLIAGVFASGAVARGASALVGRASDLNETVNKSNVIFGRSAGTILRWSKRSDTAFGLSQAAALGAAASFGDMFHQLGFTEKASAKMSKSTVKMAADLGSFNNLETSDVLERISAAMRGEYDSLQAVIPNISAARVQNVALAQTGKKSAEALTAQEKATATLAIINKDGARAMGDFKRTSDGYANSQKAVSAQVENLKTKIGTALLPVFKSVSGVLRKDVLPPLLAAADKYLPRLASSLTDVVSGFDPGAFFGRIGDAVRGIDWSAIGASVSRLADAGKQLGPAFKDSAAELPGLTDLLDVTSTVLKFAADHTDLLAKALPILAGGFIAVKGAQALANAATFLSVPLRVAEVVATRAQTKAIKELALAQAGGTVSQTLSNAATATGTRLTIRQRVAAVASAVAAKVLRGATLAWAVAQRILNAAMRANPIGIVITVIAALAAGLVYAYKKSETFRNIVNKAFGVVKAAGRALGESFGWVRDKLGDLVGWVRDIPSKLRALGGLFADAGRAIIGKFVDGLKNAAGVIGGIAGNVWDAVKGLINSGIDKINSALEFTIRIPASPDIHINPPNIPHLAGGGRVRRPTGVVLGDGHEPETAMGDRMMARMMERAGQAAAAAIAGGGGNTFNITEALNARATAREVARITAFAGGG